MSRLVEIQPSVIQNFEGELTPAGSGFRMPEKQFPWSVSPQEGRFLFECARVCSMGAVQGWHPLALEIATAFGYSTAWIAAGLSWQGGYLISMDHYMEEMSDDQDPRAMEMSIRMDKPLGLQYAQHGAKVTHTEPYVNLRVGKSPEQLESILLGRPEAMFAQCISMFFLDGHHLHGQPLIDWEAVKPHLDLAASLIVFHDTHVGDVKAALEAAEKAVGVAHYHPQLAGYNLAVVTANRAALEALKTRTDLLRSASPYSRA